MFPLSTPTRLAAGFGDSIAGIQFQQEMRRAFGGIARYGGSNHGGSGIGLWIKDDLTPNTLTLTCTTTASSTNVTTATTAALAALGETGLTASSNIPWGAKYVSTTNGTTFVINTPATASGSVSVEFSHLAQDVGVFEGLTCDELCLFFNIGTNDVGSAPAVATFEDKLDAIIAYHVAATGASRALCVATLPYHAPGHSAVLAGYYNEGQPGYNLRALLTAKAAANPDTFAVVNGDDLTRSGDLVHLANQAQNAILAGRMRDAMIGLLYP
jgi:hypothetical protein